MSSPSSELPPPPPPPQSTGTTPTQVVGQQSAPSTVVPVGGLPQSTSTVIGGRPTNTLAIASLVTALAAPFGHIIAVGGVTLIIVSLVTGHMARSQIKKTGEGGATLALLGLIISYVHIVIVALLLIFLFSAIVAFLTLIFHSAT